MLNILKLYSLQGTPKTPVALTLLLPYRFYSCYDKKKKLFKKAADKKVHRASKCKNKNKFKLVPVKVCKPTLYASQQFFWLKSFMRFVHTNEQTISFLLLQ